LTAIIATTAAQLAASASTHDRVSQSRTAGDTIHER
jgi:hypothetical protein